MKYDYLLVGAGLFSAVVGYELAKAGKKCLVIDKRSHIAGNIYTEEKEGIFIHQYGAHIFHTSNQKIWEYVQQFAPFHPFINQPIANYQGKIYNLPFNMNTFHQMWQITTPEEAKQKIALQVKESGIVHPKNLEEKAISLVGTEIYEILIKGYTEKQWGRACTELPAFIINRIPLRFTYNNNYYNDIYQGIPTGGYTQIVEKMLAFCDVRLETSYESLLSEKPTITGKIIYTGSIDQLLNYKYGVLSYRSLCFEEKVLETENYQGNAVMNFTDRECPYTRIIEHKFFQWQETSKTVISYEYPTDWTEGKEAYYPIQDEENQEKYNNYVNLLKELHPQIVLGGRLGLFSYLNMDQVIEKALTLSQELLSSQ